MAAQRASHKGALRLQPALQDHGGDAAALPANLMRTMPYTSYVAIGSYAVLFASEGAAWLEVALIASEILNSGVKKILKAIVGSDSKLLRRPEGAMDSGIYPQHFPRPSTTSGMPSGHSQASTLVAVALTSAVLQQERALNITEWSHLASEPVVLLQLAYIWLISLLVIISRTRLAGPLGVKVDGRRIAHHSILQVLVGGLVGVFLGLAAVDWFHGRPWVAWLISAFSVLFAITLVAVFERRACSSSSDSEFDNKLGSDSDRSTSSAFSDRSAEDFSSASDLELRSRPQASANSPGTIGNTIFESQR